MKNADFINMSEKANTLEKVLKSRGKKREKKNHWVHDQVSMIRACLGSGRWNLPSPDLRYPRLGALLSSCQELRKL